jgi:hypothetical protein
LVITGVTINENAYRINAAPIVLYSRVKLRIPAIAIMDAAHHKFLGDYLFISLPFTDHSTYNTFVREGRNPHHNGGRSKPELHDNIPLPPEGLGLVSTLPGLFFCIIDLCSAATPFDSCGSRCR